jgi:8-hydroxy-5-deazaflavin:NADPH oxidoreductase
MTISIIGAGNVGMALATAFAQHKQKVVLGLRDPTRPPVISDALVPMIKVSSISDAITTSEVVILATPYAATANIVQSISDWQNKIVVDATNPIGYGPEGFYLLVGTQTSGAEEISKLAKGARVVKAFNSTGYENMKNSRYSEGLALMPVCSDDAAARAKVMSLASLIGFDALDVGELSAARYLEPYAMLWIHMAMKQGMGRQFAFGLLHR